jgi:hypothetical protein
MPFALRSSATDFSTPVVVVNFLTTIAGRG